MDARFEDVRNAIQSLSSPPTTHFGGGVRSYVWGRRGCTTTSGLELLPRLVAVPGDMVVWPDFSLVLVEAVAAQSGGEDVQIKISRVRISLLFDMPHAFLISLEKISRSKCKNPFSFLDIFIFISYHFPNSIVNISVGDCWLTKKTAFMMFVFCDKILKSHIFGCSSWPRMWFWFEVSTTNFITL